MKIKLLTMFLLTLFLCSCGAKHIPKQDGHGPDLKVYMVDIDGYLANLLENGDELKKQFGNKISSDYYDTNAIAASSFGDVFEEYICNGLTSTYNENSSKLMLYNGITTKTSEEDLNQNLKKWEMNVSSTFKRVWRTVLSNLKIQITETSQLSAIHAMMVRIIKFPYAYFKKKERIDKL